MHPSGAASAFAKISTTGARSNTSAYATALEHPARRGAECEWSGERQVPFFNSSDLDKVPPPDQVRWLAAVAIVVAVVMVVLSVEHDRVATVSVSVTDPNSDAANSDIDAFRDDHWFVADVQRTGKCRHRQQRNKKKGEQSILHDGIGWGHSAFRYPPECALGLLKSV